MKTLLLLLIIAVVMVALKKFARLNILLWMVIWWVACFIVLEYGIEPPLPSSVVNMCMGIISLALAAYVAANSDYLTSAKNAFVRFLTDKKYNIPLAITLIAIPAFTAWNVYSDMTRRPQPPVSSRTIHPVPPTEITFKGKKIDLVAGENPYRKLKTSEPQAYESHVENGRRVYFQNCVFCHGDDMDGNGIFAHGLDPIPANFQDPTTIAMLQESYIFWRVAKGAPGLPPESTPWASAMPAWENFLSEEEIWDVILFMYEYTGHKPRAKEEH